MFYLIIFFLFWIVIFSITIIYGIYLSSDEEQANQTPNIIDSAFPLFVYELSEH